MNLKIEIEDIDKSILVTWVISKHFLYIPIMNTFVIIIVVCDGCFYGLFEKRIYDLCNHTHESYNEKRRGGCIIQKYTKLFTFFRWVWKRVNFIFTLFSSSSCVSNINSVSVKEKTWLVLRSCLKFCVS